MKGTGDFHLMPKKPRWEPTPEWIAHKQAMAYEGLAQKRRPKRIGCDPVRFATAEMRAIILERDSYRCRYCNVRVSAKYANFDHVIPWRDRGPTSPENLVTSCGSCNKAKGNLPIRPRRIGKPVRDWFHTRRIREEAIRIHQDLDAEFRSIINDKPSGRES